MGAPRPQRDVSTPLRSTRHDRRGVRGLTLIELLVVIAVIAVLMAILLPVLGGVRKQAKALRCQSNLRQWGPILQQYLDDNDGRFPVGSGTGAWLLRGGSLDVQGQVTPYAVRTEGIAQCPRAVKPPSRHQARETFFVRYADAADVVWQALISYGSTFETWEVRQPEPCFRSSYGMNHHLSWALASSGIRNATVFSIKGRASIPVLLDCASQGCRPNGRDRPPPSPESLGVSSMAQFCIDRHDGHINGLFLDWTVRKLGLKELWTLRWNDPFDRSGPWTKAGGVQPEDWPEWMRGFRDY